MSHTDVHTGFPATTVDVKNELALYPGDAIVVGVFEDGVLSPAAKSLDDALDGLLKAVIDTGDMKGKNGSRALVYTLGRIPSKRAVLVGLGKKADVDAERLRRVSGDTLRHLRDLVGRRDVALRVGRERDGRGSGGRGGRVVGAVRLQRLPHQKRRRRRAEDRRNDHPVGRGCRRA
ncbi:MAG: hypothetical protein O3A46_00660 [Candidatus Poribacteria bacterium]|nr:hypothetical protein [Candidatus Poribacteria bacterium]